MNRRQLASLASQLLRSAGAALTAEELEDGFTDVAVAAWDDVFDDLVDAAEQAVLAGADAEGVDAAIGAVLLPWPSEDRTTDMIAWIADSFASGKSDVLGRDLRSSASRIPPSVEVMRNPADPMDPLGVLEDAIPHLLEELDDFAVMMAAVAPDAFALTDADTARWLGKDTMFWVGAVHSNDLGRRIAGTVSDVMAQGGRRDEQAAALRAALGAKYERSDAYWRQVAAAVTNRARNFGSVSGFEAADITRYRITAIIDESTTLICQTMDGKEFEVVDAVQLRDDLLATEDPVDAKAVSPWLPETEFVAVADQGDDALIAAGFALPPYHGNCRTVVDGL